MKVCVAWMLVVFGGMVPLCAADLYVHAAASLADAMREIGRVYEERSGERVVLNFGSSSTLARQIEEGAPADLFFSADEEKLDNLVEKGLVAKESKRVLLKNKLAVVVLRDDERKITSAEDLLKAGRIALGQPATVPAGIYARQWLEKAGVWDRVKDSVVPTENVRAALAAVESGNVEAGVVYKTDAAISGKVRVAFEVAGEAAPDITYPAGIATGSRHPEAAGKLLDFLGSEKCAGIFRKFGFIVPR